MTGPNGRNGVPVIRCDDPDGVNIFLVRQIAEIGKRLGLTSRRPPHCLNWKAYRSVSFMTNRSRIGFPARRLRSDCRCQVTIRFISLVV